MAWVLSQRGDSVRYVPKIDPVPDYVDHQTRLSYLLENGFFPDGMLKAGKAIDDRFWPVAGRFATPVDLVPRMLGLRGFPLIPETWRDAIEEFEPGVHRFKHIPLKFSDGTELEEKFYAMHIRQVLRDIVDRERSTARRKVDSGGEVFVNASAHPMAKIVFKKGSISHFHLWASTQVLSFYIVMSDALYDRISSIDELSSVHCLHVDEA